MGGDGAALNSGPEARVPCRFVQLGTLKVVPVRT